MNYLQKLMLVLCLSILFLSPGYSQNKEDKTVNVKIEKEIDGKKTVLDTNFVISNLKELEKLESLNELLDDETLNHLKFDINADSLSKNIQICIKQIEEGMGDSAMNVFVSENGDLDDLEKEIEIVLEKLDADLNLDSLNEQLGNMNKTMTYSYEIEDDSDTNGTQFKVIIHSKGAEDSAKKMMFVSSDEDSGDHQHMDVEIEEGDDGKKVIITENGETREYSIDGDQGVFFIDDDGNVEKVDEDIDWESDGTSSFKYKVNVDRDEDNDAGAKKKVMIKKIISDEDVDIDADGKHEVMVWLEDGDDVDDGGETEVFVEVNGDKGTTDKKTVHKIRIKSLNDKDYSLFKKAGITRDPNEGQKMEIEHFMLKTTNDEGSYQLSFSLGTSGKTEVFLIEDSGKIIFNDKLNEFEGKYEHEIKLKAYAENPIYLLVKQDGKYGARRINVE